MTNFQRIFYWLLTSFLAILSISGTIALRNVLHAALLVMIVWALFLSPARLCERPMAVARKVPLSVYGWCVFLVLFPLWAAEPSVAWFNLRGQWGESILTWLLAFGAVLILGTSRHVLWWLALVSAAPVFLHLGLTMLAWGGLLRPVFYSDPSLTSLWSSLKEITIDPSLWYLTIQPFPMGFRGVEPMHGNLGYAASQAMALGLACVFQTWENGTGRKMVKAITLVGACFVSVLIAGSRGAVYFGLGLIGLAGVLYAISVAKRHASYRLLIGRTTAKSAWYGLAVLIGVVMLVGAFWNTARSNVRWYSMWDKLELGWVIEQPVLLLCEGVPAEAEILIKSRYGARGDAYVQELKAGLQGQDGARILLMRAGAGLVAQHPWGLDGSRQAYQKRIEQVCGHTPTLEFSHAHQAWINLSLALGWLGAMIFAWVFVSFGVRGSRLLTTPGNWVTGLALILLAVFWTTRGMVDAVYQEHYLQMQAFLLLFVWLSVCSKDSVKR